MADRSNFDQFLSNIPASLRSTDPSFVYHNLEHILSYADVIDITANANMLPDPAITPQLYVMRRRPSIRLLQTLPEYDDGNVEAGIFLIKGIWFLITAGYDNSLSNTLSLPEILRPLSRKGLFNMDLHAHPSWLYDKYTSGIPKRTRNWPGLISDDDLLMVDNTINNRLLVCEKNGLATIAKPTVLLPGGIDFSKLDTSTPGNREQALRDLKFAFIKYLSMCHLEPAGLDPWKVLVMRREYFRKYFHHQLIPWQHSKTITSVLEQQINPGSEA